MAATTAVLVANSGRNWSNALQSVSVGLGRRHGLFLPVSQSVRQAAAAARMLGRVGDTNAAPGLVSLVSADNPGVRLAAAEAIAHCGSAASVPAVLASLSQETDPFLQH